MAVRSEGHPIDAHDLDYRFDYHAPPNDTVRELHESIRTASKAMGHLLQDKIPPGREQALAMTNLELVMFWANAAIARNHDQVKE